MNDKLIENLRNLMKIDFNQFVHQTGEFISHFDPDNPSGYDEDFAKAIKTVMMEKMPELPVAMTHEERVVNAFSSGLTKSTLEQLEMEVARLQTENEIISEANTALKAVVEDLDYDKILRLVQKDFVKQQRNFEQVIDLRWPSLDPTERKLLVNLIETHFRDALEYIQVPESSMVVTDLEVAHLIEFNPDCHTQVRLVSVLDP